MASWFRAAEELFEVVDRRAKKVTDDLLVGGPNPAADLGVFGRVLATSPLTNKGQDGSGKALEDTSPSTSNGSKSSSPFEVSTEDPLVEVVEANTQNVAPLLACDVSELENGHKYDGDNELVREGPAPEFEPVECKFVAEDGRVIVELISKTQTLQESSSRMDGGDAPRQPLVEKVGNGVTTDFPPGFSEDGRQKEVPKLEEQLDEAHKLLKVAPSSGQSKEARLARVCAGLSSRLQEYKSENAQLEALVEKEREENSSLRSNIKELQSELASTRAAVSSVEAEMSSAFASKNAEIEALLVSLESFKKQAAHSEGKLAALQAEMEAMARSRDMTENGMIQSLKEALEAAENRAEEEHLLHVATRKAAAQREAELEQCVADVTASLTRMQRTVDERTQRAAELEHKLSMLEVDCASLNQELQEAEAKLRKEQKRLSDDATQTSQIQAWREDADRARQAQREVEGKNLSLEAENQKLRVELAAIKREADQLSSQAQVELEKRFRELTEVLYLKQTQLEAMASEKAAAIFQLEKELSRAREAQAEADKNRKLRHSITVWDDESEMKTLESWGLQQRRLVGPSIQTAAKFLDTGAVTAGRFLWRRPLARLGVLLYLVFVHGFLLYLLHRLQEQVLDSMSSKEELAAAGLVKLGMRQ